MNEPTKSDIDEIKVNTQKLTETISDFVVQYEVDMRGDKDMTDGNRGVIGEIREIKKYQQENPSLIWLIKHKPFTTMGSILMIFLFLMTLYNLGLMKFILVYFGVPIP
jgi:hypothetical protein